MGKRLSVHFSSKSEEWETPKDLFDDLDATFQFNLDACATAKNAKCAAYFTKETDALKQRWRGRVWMNPPYGRPIAAFMRKAYLESLLGATVVCLVPSRPGSLWWKRFVMRGDRFDLPHRLKFGGAKSSAPFPSAIVIFWGGILGQALRPAPLPENGPE